jgi:hypothetical protein
MHENTSNSNPLREGIVTRRTTEPCVLVIFGATDALG